MRGDRSAAKTLAEMGIENVASLAGGFPVWQQAGGPTGR
jgi:rhodanese-related sulfurtransferase